MWKSVIIHSLLAIGKLTQDYRASKNSYKPMYDGRWVNKGSDYDEDWQWVEPKSLRTYYINVFEVEEDTYSANLSLEPSPDAVEVVDCDDERTVEIAFELLEVYYGHLGSIVMNKTIG